MKVIYICGPIRNDDAEIQKRNIGKGMLAAKAIWQAGGVALSPHALAYFWGNDDAPASKQTNYLAGDLEMINRSDAILALPGWKHSKGATAEVLHCTENGIKIFDDLAEAVEWVKS